jgi:hypothetical protein
MHGQCFYVPHVSAIVLLGLSVLCVPLAWAQRTLLTKQTSIQLSDHAVPLAAFPEAKTSLFPSYKKIPLSFTPNLGQPQSGPGFSSRASGIHLLFPPNKPALGLDSKANYLIGNDPERWQTHVFTHTYYQRAYPRDLQYYGQRAPLVGSSILHILKQADSHPRVTRVLQLLKPKF